MAYQILVDRLEDSADHLEAGDLDVTLRNVTARRLAGLNPSRGFDFAGSGTTTITMDDCTVDLSAFTSAVGANGINVGSDSITVRSSRFRFIGAGGAQTSTALVSSGGASAGNGATVELLDYRYWHGSINPTIIASGITKRRQSGRTIYGTTWDKDVTSALLRVTAATAVSLAGIAERADAVMTVELGGSAGAVTTGNLPVFADGVRQGQVVKLYNKSNGIVTIPSTGVLPAVTTDIAVDGYVQFTYHGDYWRRS